MDISQVVPLYCRYPGQTAPQPAFIEFSLEDDEAPTADYSGDIGCAIPFDVYNRRTIRVAVSPSLSGDAVRELLNSELVSRAVSIIRANSEVVWDGRSMVGKLGDEALEALEHLEEFCDEFSEREENLVEVWEPDNYLLWWSPKPGQSVGDMIAELPEVDFSDNRPIVILGLHDYLRERYQ